MTARNCPACGSEKVTSWWAQVVCKDCGFKWHPMVPSPKDDEREVVPEKVPEFDDTVLDPLSRIHAQRVIQYKGHPFIASEVLEMYDDYYDHTVGLVVSVMGPGGSTIFFELAALVSGTLDKGRQVKGYLLIRIDPEREFDDLPVWDVDPRDATILDGKAEEAGSGGDEAP